MRLRIPVALCLLFILSACGNPNRDCADCPLMVTVPAGSFMMGSPETEPGHNSREGRLHAVSIQGFSIAATEVTRDQFAAFVQATGYHPSGDCWGWDQSTGDFVKSNGMDWETPGFAQDGSHPVVCVDWEDARAYARWLSQMTGKNYRLPTEAEWEYAARAETGTAFHWGDAPGEACSHANVLDQAAVAHANLPADQFHLAVQCSDGHAFTAPFGQFRANAFGLHDMSGNVWEWTMDCWNGSYTGAPSDGTAWVTGDCDYRVVRGGSWLVQPWYVRSAVRDGVRSSNRINDFGFRVARTD